jgi:hypothetical protein
MSKIKDLSWIEEAWHYSREAEQDLITAIEQYYEYQSEKNVQMHQAHPVNAREVQAH